MTKYSLEVENWNKYEHVKDFSSINLAKKHGTDNFPQNKWRLFDRIEGCVVYDYNPMEHIGKEALQHLERFDNTDKWRNKFARMTEIARRQRQSQRNRAEERRQRLSGFRFVDERIDPTLNGVFGISSVDKELDDKINWKKEGF